MGFPAALPANQATRQAERQAERQPQCSCGKQRLISSPAFLLWTKNTGWYITQEDNAANVNSAKLSSALLYFLLTFTLLLSPSLSLFSTSCLQPSVCKQIPAHVIRCLHHSYAFTAPSFRLPPSLPARLPSLYLSPLWVFPSTPHLPLPLQLQAIIEVAAEQMADRQMWMQARKRLCYHSNKVVWSIACYL